jgi:hypothetical protein
VLTDVVLDDLGHQAIHAAACCSKQVKDFGTAVFGFEGTFDGLDLAAYPTYPVQ